MRKYTILRENQPQCYGILWQILNCISHFSKLQLKFVKVYLLFTEGEMKMKMGERKKKKRGERKIFKMRENLYFPLLILKCLIVRDFF